MDNLHYFLSSFILSFIVTDGFTVMLNDTIINNTFSRKVSDDKITHSRNKMKLTTIYLFTIVWLILIALGYLFYWFLYNIYIPKLKKVTTKSFSTGKRKNQMFYNYINRRYHKHRKRTIQNVSMIINKYCQKCINKNASNRRNDCSENEKRSGGCLCCGKSNKSDSQQCSESKGNIEFYRSRQRECIDQNTNPRQYEPQQFPRRTQPAMQKSSLGPESQTSVNHKIEKITHSEVINETTPNIEPQQESMLHHSQQPLLQNPQPPPPSQIPPQFYSQLPPGQQYSRHTQRTVVSSVPVQSYGGSSRVTADDEKTTKKGGCCAPKKKSSGEIHAKIHGYKVEGHIRVKGEKNKNTISIPEDTYMVTR